MHYGLCLEMYGNVFSVVLDVFLMKLSFSALWDALRIANIQSYPKVIEYNDSLEIIVKG